MVSQLVLLWEQDFPSAQVVWELALALAVRVWQLDWHKLPRKRLPLPGCRG